MLRMGFDDSWVALVMSHVRTTSLSIVINGKPGLFQPIKRFEARGPFITLPFPLGE